MSSSPSSPSSSLSSPEEVKGRQCQSSSNCWVPSASQGDSTSPKTPSSSDIEALASEAVTHTLPHTQQIRTERGTPLHKDLTHDLMDDDLIALCNSGQIIKEETLQNDPPPTSQFACNQVRIESDRQEEFEERSSRARAAARQKTEQTSTDSDEATRAQDRSTEKDNMDEARKESESIKRDSNSSESGGEQVVPEQRFVIVTPRIQAPWVDEVFSACKANKKNPLREGNLLIVLDPNDYSKTCLVDSRDFCKASESLAQVYLSSKAASQGCSSEQKLSGLLIFSVSSSTPGFHPLPLDCSVADLTQTLELRQQPTAAKKTKIKLEFDRKTTDGVESNQASSSETHSIASYTDWPKACDSLLRIIARVRAHGVSKTEPAAALPQVEGIISIAQKYEVIHEVQGAFDSLFFGYIGSGKFWKPIAQAPVRYLKIGIALKTLTVYEEAFKHLVGSSASFKAGKRFDDLPDAVQAIIHRRSHELYDLRRDINEDLLLISLEIGQYDGSGSDAHPSSTVSQHNQPDAYSTVNIVRDWMAEHIGYLRSDTSKAPAPHYLCEHKHGCNTVAGFYRLVAAGGETYLPINTVWEKFNTDFLEADTDGEFELEAVNLPLAALKTEASEYVSALVKSTLHLPGKDELDYLTCVTVGPEDVPWDITCKDGESEDDEDGD